MNKLIKLSEDYFGFMAYSYPVMSLSDEFYFFPRAKKAIQHLDCLDSLNKEKIKQDISCIKSLKQNLERLDIKNIGLEAQIDWYLLRQSMSGYLREFQQIKVWQSDPNLYLKIIVLGIEQIVCKLSMIKPNIQKELACRIKQIPRLLNEAKVNLTKIPLLYQKTAIELTEAISNYLQNQLLLSLPRGLNHSELTKLSKKAIHSLGNFKAFLKRKSGSQEFIRDKEILKDLLINSFSYKRDLKEIFGIACDEHQKTLSELKKVANYIRPSRSWRSLLSDYRIKVKNTKELLYLYSAQIVNLKNFLKRHKLIGIPKMQNIKVLQTPLYLSALRASASYSCPLTKNQREAALFYVSIDSKARIWENIHQEHIFVAAHETYPGHHLLDSIRDNIKNPIRQQIESALFYEGWASYAERLIDQFEYLNDPRQRLVGLRRQAWRAIRAKLDVGIRINKMKPSDAAEELRWLGYNSCRVKAMLRHYVLTCGYQLCYTIGKFEIERLKKKFAPQMGIKNFHDHLLAGGELPFDLINRRMEKICRKNS